MTHLHSQMSITKTSVYSSSSQYFDLITQSNPHTDPMSAALFKALGRSKARYLPFMSADIAVMEALKSGILSTLSSQCSQSSRQRNSV